MVDWVNEMVVRTAGRVDDRAGGEEFWLMRTVVIEEVMNQGSREGL